MKRTSFVALAVPLVVLGATSNASADHGEEQVVIESQPVEVGPVSTSTPRITRSHDDEDFLASLQRCAESLQITVERVGCPEQ